jgi:hypothetical protein
VLELLALPMIVISAPMKQRRGPTIRLSEQPQISFC